MLETFGIVTYKVNKKRKIVFKNNFAVAIGLIFLFRLRYVECNIAVTLIGKILLLVVLLLEKKLCDGLVS